MPNNILFFFVDDMPFKMWPNAPESRRLIQLQGTDFVNGRCNYSLCQPCRIGFYSGMTYKRHGVGGNGPTGAFDHHNTIGKWVHDVGYRTGQFGKYMNVSTVWQPKPTGWDTWIQFLQPSGSTDEGQDAWAYDVTDGTVTTHPGIHQQTYLLNQVGPFVLGSEPWMAIVCPMSPHSPIQPFPQDIHAWSNYNYPVVMEHNPVNKPSWIMSAPDVPETSTGTFQLTARGQARELIGVDAMIKSVIESLSPTVLDRTTIFFASDNGMYYGEHRNPNNGVSKLDLYECAAHVPVWAKGTGFPVKATRTTPVMVAQDITATIALITGASVPWAMDGVDLRDVATNPGSYTSRAVLQQRASGAGQFVLAAISANGISTETRKLIQHEVANTGTTYSQEVLADAPAVFLKMDETSGTVANDSSGNGRHVTLSSAPAWRNFMLGTCGATISNQQGVLADAAWMESTDITIEAWIKTSAATYSVLVDRRTVDDVFGFSFRGDTTGKLEALSMGSQNGTAPDGIPDTTVGPTQVVNNNVVHHVVMRVDSQALTANPRTISLIVDGNLIASNTGAHGLWVLGNVPMIFFGQGAGSRQFVGQIANVAFYPTALSDTRILTHYTVGSQDLSTDRYELYDLVNDPEELTNQAFAGGSWLTERNNLKAILDTLWP